MSSEEQTETTLLFRAIPRGLGVDSVAAPVWLLDDMSWQEPGNYSITLLVCHWQQMCCMCTATVEKSSTSNYTQTHTDAHRQTHTDRQTHINLHSPASFGRWGCQSRLVLVVVCVCVCVRVRVCACACTCACVKKLKSLLISSKYSLWSNSS